LALRSERSCEPHGKEAARAHPAHDVGARRTRRTDLAEVGVDHVLDTLVRRIPAIDPASIQHVERLIGAEGGTHQASDRHDTVEAMRDEEWWPVPGRANWKEHFAGYPPELSGPWPYFKSGSAPKAHAGEVPSRPTPSIKRFT